MFKIKDRLLILKERLTNIGNEEPLSKLSLVVIMALDLFILFIIFGGMYDHTKQMTYPGEYIPNECQQIFIKNNWSPENQLTKLQKLILSDYNSYSYGYDSQFSKNKIEVMHPVCKAFYAKVKLIKETKELETLFVSRQNLIKNQTQISYNFEESKNVSNTHLLTNIARKDNKTTPVLSIVKTIKTHTKKLEDITLKLSKIEEQINKTPEVMNLWEIISPNNRQRENIIEDFKKFQYWHPVKKLVWQFVFLLPIFVTFYLWSSISVKRNNNIQILISSHMLTVASIPIILRIIEVVLDLIPHVFFKKLFKVLESLHLIAVWHYIVIFGSVGIALFTIYIIQKKIFNKARIYQKRLIKGECCHCGKRLLNKVSNCPFCGTKQLKVCNNCQEETDVGGPYCKNCGCKS